MRSASPLPISLEIVEATADNLPRAKPRYALGVGMPAELPMVGSPNRLAPLFTVNRTSVLANRYNRIVDRGNPDLRFDWDEENISDLAVLGPVLASISDVERRTLEMAAFLPPDVVALPWLKALVDTRRRNRTWRSRVAWGSLDSGSLHPSTFRRQGDADVHRLTLAWQPNT